MNKKNGFTLVELLAVIVILAVILVIAVPSIMSTITESRKGALASSAKVIASSAETMKISNDTLGITNEIRCEDVSNYNTEDYTCNLEFVDGNAEVTLIGNGKFEGMCVRRGTKEDAEAEKVKNGECPTPFGKDSWTTIKAAVTAGDTSKYRVGDTKTVNLGSLGTHTVRIANKSNDWEHCGENGYSQTACGFVIEFADIISNYNMNPPGEYKEIQYDNGWNKDGWPASAMRKYLNDLDNKDNTDGVIYNALPEELRNVIIDTTVVSSHGSEDTSNFTSRDKVYLLSTREVWGKEGTSNQITYDTADGDTITRQLDYYATYVNADGTQGVTTSKYAGAIKKNSSNSASSWWLRSAYSIESNDFYIVRNTGTWFDCNASNTPGVSPAFRLG